MFTLVLVVASNTMLTFCFSVSFYPLINCKLLYLLSPKYDSKIRYIACVGVIIVYNVMNMHNNNTIV